MDANLYNTPLAEYPRIPRILWTSLDYPWMLTYNNTSSVLEHKWRASLKTILFLLTSNTEATENKVQFFYLAYRVKGFQCHSNNSLQLLELKEKTTTTKQYTLFKSFLCDIL